MTAGQPLKIGSYPQEDPPNRRVDNVGWHICVLDWRSQITVFGPCCTIGEKWGPKQGKSNARHQ